MKCNQIEAECDRWQSDYETLKVEYGAYESDIKAWSDEELEQKIGKFILGKALKNIFSLIFLFRSIKATIKK